MFELLLPNGLKDQSNENADLVLVLDEAAAAFPWEILAARTRDRIDPLSVKAGMLRQLKVDAFRVGPRGARDYNALVIGDNLTGTARNQPELPGAQRRRRWRNNWRGRPGRADDPPTVVDIIRQLFARLSHHASGGHGIYNPEPEKAGGARPQPILTSLELAQVRTSRIRVHQLLLPGKDRHPPPLDGSNRRQVSPRVDPDGSEGSGGAGWL